MTDPFERFERSRSGLLIPVAIFLLGAVPTVLAIESLDHLVVLDEPPPANQDVDAAAADDPQVQLAPEVDQAAAEEDREAAR